MRNLLKVSRRSVFK